VILNLAYVTLHQGDGLEAAALFAQSLALRQEYDVIADVLVMVGLAGVAAVTEQPAQAARLFGAAEALVNAIWADILPVDRAEYDRYVAAARAKLDEASFAAAWAEGRALSFEQAITEALDR